MSVLILITGFAIALVLSIGITPLVTRLASTYGLFDHPDVHLSGDRNRRVHLRPVPRLGGFAIVAAFFLTYIAAQQNLRIPTILLLSLLIFAIGAIDDLRPISASFRFLLQVLICGIVVYVGDLSLERIYFGTSSFIDLPQIVGFITSTFIIVGAINALNMVDGLDGLAGGVSVIALAMLSLLYYLASDDARLTAYLSIPTIGAILGFLRYNTHPATIFMGDNGSNWLGFMIGLHIVLILSDTNPFWITASLEAGSAPLAVPLISAMLCFAVPIFDTAFVICGRVISGKHPMAADKSHFHHSLLKLGLTQAQSVTFIYFISLAMAILGILPIAYPQYKFDYIPYIGVAFIVLILLASVRIQWSSQYKNPLRSILSEKIHNDGGYKAVIDYVIRIWERTNKYCILAILAVIPAFAGPLPASIGYAAVPLLVLTILTFFLNNQRNSFIESFILTISWVLLLTANNHNLIQVEILGELHNINGIYNGIFVFLFFSSSVFILVTLKRNYLVLTPSDFLLLTLPIVLVLFPPDLKNEYRLDIISIRSFIIFIGYRSLEMRRVQARRHLKLATLFALTYIVMVSIFEMRFVY